MARKKGMSIKQTAEIELLIHIQHLGLKTIEEYRHWCIENGFQSKLSKRHHQRKQELLHYQEMVVESRLKQKKKEKKSIVDKLSLICSENVSLSKTEDPLLKKIYTLYFSYKDIIDRSETIRNSFLRLVSHLYCCKVKIFDCVPTRSELEYKRCNCYLEALVFISVDARSWIRPIEEWRPSTSNARRQFASLLRHLFVEYQMPLFFDSVWLVNNSRLRSLWRDWYLDVGRGQNIRHCRLPITYTKKMSHYFMRAPQDLTIQQAIRWGQILGMGGNASLARSILATRIGEGFSRDEFWSNVILWFILHPQVDRIQIRAFVDYFIFQRYRISSEEFDEDAIPVNDYSIKGRTLKSLLRDVTEWHREQERKDRVPEYEWESSGLPEFEFLDRSRETQYGKRWIIRELLNSYELETEGSQMNHCVGTYVSSCVRGECSIWSMEIELKNGFKKALTIEVCKDTNQICEVRGKANRIPNKIERSVLRRWAKTSGLSVSNYI